MKTVNLIGAFLSMMMAMSIALTFTACGGGGGGTGTNSVSNETNAVASDSTDNLIQTISDSDGDGMVDSAEVKYGFDPTDASSFPTLPTVIEEIEASKIDINNTGVGLIAEIGISEIILKWNNTTTSEYTLVLNNGSLSIYYGGHHLDYAIVNYGDFNLTGTEVLNGYFLEYDKTTGSLVSTTESFIIDLNTITTLPRPIIGSAGNRISFTYKDFNTTSAAVYTDFLTKVWPIMESVLGVPAENFNCVITNMGPDSPYFMIVDSGRTFLSTQEFIPRLIVHEFIHAWKGDYQITADAHWDYHDALSGFEEGLAEGYAFEIIHEYTKAYPNDSATEQLLAFKPYQYSSPHANHYDVTKLQRQTTAGGFWTITGSHEYRYNSAAVTVQNISIEYPNFYKDTQARIYEEINADETWRPTRTNILDIWSEVAPTVQGIELHKYIDALPVFKGAAMDDGFYLQSVIRQYGGSGDIQFAVAYALDGLEWWNLKEIDISSKNLPNELEYIIGSDGWVYPNMQSQYYTYDVHTDNTLFMSSGSTTGNGYSEDGIPDGLGWDKPSDIQQENFDVGLYRADVTFTNFTAYANSTESAYFFGAKDTSLSDEETVIMVGIDSVVSNLSMSLKIDDLVTTVNVVNSMGYFKFTDEIAKGYETVMTIDVTSTDKVCSYKRTLLDTVTLWSKSEFGYIIIDKDFNCVEDIYE